MTPFPPSAVLPQAKLNIPEKVYAILPPDVSLSIPETAGDLYAIADEHKHALRYFAGDIMNGDFLLFTLHDSTAGEYYTFDFYAKNTAPQYGTFRHAVGLHNTKAPEHLASLANAIAHHLLMAK